MFTILVCNKIKQAYLGFNYSNYCYVESLNNCNWVLTSLSFWLHSTVVSKTYRIVVKLNMKINLL